MRNIKEIRAEMAKLREEYEARITVGEFYVDVSCPLKDFDRWANSVDEVVNFYNWIEE